MMTFLSYFMLIAPAAVFISIPSVLIAANRLSISQKSIGLAVFCIAMLPIRMWESIVLAIAASVSGILFGVAIRSIQKTSLRSVFANPHWLTVLSIGIYTIVKLTAPSTELLIGESPPIITVIMLGFEWISIGIFATVELLLLWIQFRFKVPVGESKTQDEATRGQIGLRNLLMTVLAIAIGFAALRISIPKIEYFPLSTYLLIGTVAGISLAFIGWMLRLRRLWHAFPFCLFSLCLVAELLSVAQPEPDSLSFDFPPWTVVGLLQTIILIGGVALFVSTLFSFRNKYLPRRAIQCAFAIAVLLFVFPTIRIYAYMFRPWMTPPAVQPIEGNKYDEIIALMSELDMNFQSANNTRTLNQISAIVMGPSVVSVPDLYHNDNVLKRDAARAFVDDALKLATRNKPDLALDRLLTCVQLNQRMIVGGGTTDLLAKLAIDDDPFNVLIKQRHEWNPGELTLVQKRLTTTLRHTEPIEAVNRRTRNVDQYIYRWFDGLIEYDIGRVEIDGLFSTRLHNRKIDRHVDGFAKEDKLWFDLLIADCATRRFAADTGHLPTSLEQLVPDYLEAVPDDPFANQPFTFRKNGWQYLLYSFGHNKHDDGGTRSRSDGDIRLPDPVIQLGT